MTGHRSSSGLLLLTVLAFSPPLPGQGLEKKQESKPAKININTATAVELAALPGIGEATAASIVQHRKISGPFRKIEELLVIQRISRQKFEELRGRITVEEIPGKGKAPF